MWTRRRKEAFNKDVQCKIIVLFKFAFKENWKYILIFRIKSSFQMYSEFHLLYNVECPTYN